MGPNPQPAVMSKTEKYTYFSDPLHGFIALTESLLRLVSRREVQRLRHIRQFGSGHLVFPVGEHSRFTHALGSLALMGDALDILKRKGTEISAIEQDAAMAAMLLHDIGHSPFSHALEYWLIRDTRHESISLALMERVANNPDTPEDLACQLNLAMEMFSGVYGRAFFHELIAGHLDIDRLDYLQRDSNMSGVIEGSVGVDRILQTMCVGPDESGSGEHIAIEAKGLPAVVNFLTARYHMYWQVYLHKAVLAADAVLTKTMLRARHLIKQGRTHALDGISPGLAFFLTDHHTRHHLKCDQVLDMFISVDDTDVIYSLKRWCESSDRVLRDLSRRFINRRLFRCEFFSSEPSTKAIGTREDRIAQYLEAQGLGGRESVQYYAHLAAPDSSAYEEGDNPVLIRQHGNIPVPLREVLNQPGSISGLPKTAKKYYFCYPKGTEL